jgi:chromosome segregation ATPase
VETAARDRAERSLAEAQTIIRDLQTKIGHAELAKNEAVDAAQREREAHAALQAAAEDHSGQLAEAEERVKDAEDALERAQTALSEERGARKAAERSLREAVAAREHAELLLRELSEELTREPAPPAKQRVSARPAVEPVADRRRAKFIAPVPEVEPEPVKWWLMEKPTPKRR